MAFSTQHSQSQALTVTGLYYPVVSSRPISEVPEMPIAVCLREQKLCVGCRQSGVLLFGEFSLLPCQERANQLVSSQPRSGHLNTDAGSALILMAVFSLCERVCAICCTAAKNFQEKNTSPPKRTEIPIHSTLIVDNIRHSGTLSLSIQDTCKNRHRETYVLQGDLKSLLQWQMKTRQDTLSTQNVPASLIQATTSCSRCMIESY